MEFLSFTLVTDHIALKWLQNAKKPKGICARWVMELQQFKFDIKHRPGKANANADALSRMYEGENEREVQCFMMDFRAQYQGNWSSDDESRPPSPPGTSYRQNFNQGRVERYPEEERYGKNWAAYDYGTDTWDELASEKERFFWDCCGKSECSCYEEYEEYRSQSDNDNFEMEERLNQPRKWAINPDLEELEELYRQNIVEKNVVANQPIRTGGSRCTFACDTENHHTHFYCKICKTNLAYGVIFHPCKMGYEYGQIHPVMDPKFLINHPWWKEPPQILAENNLMYFKQFIYLYLAQLQSNEQPQMSLNQAIFNYFYQQEVEILPLD